MKTKKRRLKIPIYVGTIPIKGTNEELSEAWIAQQKAIETLPLLFERYGIADKSDYFGLALALTIEHVIHVKRAPLRLKHGTWGAVIRDGIGRPTDWTRERLLEWLNAVEDETQRSKCSTDREAIGFLMRKKKEWQPPANHRGSLEQWLETLESRLQDAKRIKREERDGAPAFDPDSAAILYELQEDANLASANQSAATAYATLPMELRFAALCLPLSSKIPEIETD